MVCQCINNVLGMLSIFNVLNSKMNSKAVTFMSGGFLDLLRIV